MAEGALFVVAGWFIGMVAGIAGSAAFFWRRERKLLFRLFELEGRDWTE